MNDTLTASSLTAEHIASFRKIVGEEYVFIDGEALRHYSHD